MRASSSVVGALVLAAALGVAGCGHKLVAGHGEASVPIFPDESTYQKLGEMKKQGGAMGMIGGFGESVIVKKADDKTPIRIIGSDSEGAKIEVTEGPNKGLTGFAAKENVD